MIEEAIRHEMALIKDQIDYEEAAERGYDYKKVRQLRDKYYTLAKLLENNDKESVDS